MLVANESGLYLPQDNGNPAPGIACMANASRFTEAHFSEPLTTYATGWRDQEGLLDLLDFIAPPVEVPRKFEYATFVNTEAFLSETDDIRAIGADFKRVEYTQSKVTSTTLNKGLTYRVDLDNVDQNTNWREKIVSQLQLRVLRNDVRRAMALLVTAGASNATTPNWGASGSALADIDPDGAVLAAAINANNTIGIPCNRVLYDLTAWSRRSQCLRSKASAAGFGSANIDVNQVAQLCGLQAGMIARHTYQSSPSAKTGVVGGTYVLVFLANNSASIDDPSHIKRFVTQTMGGTMVRVYEQQVSMKLIDITVEMYSRPVATSTLGVQRIAPSFT